ncbi:class II 3-deoxy-7-phosphoheptulonate synthase [Spirillospora sp. NPDC048911]|uniref:class II 3-deoxy-7-phosphoheptulonate synthase n=1 Tax=Spirillospora sp. NPDC048911 TaxID=3364527 RepID=UPI003723B3C2
MKSEQRTDSWRSFPAAQQPEWPDAEALRHVLSELGAYPPLVEPGECDRLRARLGEVARGEAFLLQAGDCAETFDRSTAEDVRNKLETMLQMSAVLSYAVSVPVVKVGRIAGQYGKPRSQPAETRDGITLPSYRGDAVNGTEFTPEARTPDPERLKRMYRLSSTTLKLIRGFATEGHSVLRHLHDWKQCVVAGSPPEPRHEPLAGEIDRTLRFMRICGVESDAFGTDELYTSHEALLLDYESALTRTDARTGRTYDLSGHLLWIGERTRDPDGAHVEFASRIRNPIAVKLGPAATASEVLALIERLDPRREPGRLTFITRMGAGKIRDRLPDLMQAVTASGGAQVAWICDPMHGNTFQAPSGHKTRRFGDVLQEIDDFFAISRALGIHPGGIHVELTGDNVTECVGGRPEIRLDALGTRYETACDPRLNRSQALELALHVAETYVTDQT